MGAGPTAPKTWSPESKGDPQLQSAKRETEAQGKREMGSGTILPMQSSISDAEEPEQLEVMQII